MAGAGASAGLLFRIRQALLFEAVVDERVQDNEALCTKGRESGGRY